MLAAVEAIAQGAGGSPATKQADRRTQGDKRMTIEITSTAFKHEQPIPKKFTGEGADVSPPLAWSGVPKNAKEIVLICDDPDAPTPEPWVHWVLYGLSPTIKALPEGIARKPRLQEPVTAIQGNNSWPAKEAVGYRGPMPPQGHGVHHYYFKLYALDTNLDAESGLSKKAVLAKIRDHIVAEGVLMGTYERRKP
jgi:Raf kinase inhibitor-like YbhB/YbcL family protein